MDTCIKVALIEDNDDLRDLLYRDIKGAGYSVFCAGCADDLDDFASRTSFNILVLDINLPGENGLSIARRYKKANPHLYIVMLTARGDTNDKITGYASGADIYLTKPVASEELLAAIGGVARRIQLIDTETDFFLDLRKASLFGRGSVELNRQEMILLKALAESVDGNLPYYRLLELCEEEVHATSKATLEVRIVRLRKKLAEVGVNGNPIRAMRGEGYQLLQRIKIK